MRQARPRHGTAEPPLRAELFSIEQLERHAQAMAAHHKIVVTQADNLLLARLQENEQVLKDYNGASLATDQSRQVTPASEWLLDNFYLIEEQIQIARRHLPRMYNRELPRLSNGASAGLPRVYDIVLELISHVDGQIDAGPLTAFVAAYQTGAALKLGELWAVPIMLRLALIENLRRITARLMTAREERARADLWVDRLQEMAEKDPSHLVVVVADMAESDLPLTSPFVAEFCQRLARQNPLLHLARSWLEQRLGEEGLSTEQLIQRESQNQAADQVSVSHSITSLRFLSAMDWKEFVETLSLVHQTLATDPAGVYTTMDFATRDRYRHAVEVIARYSRESEIGIAQKAIHLAEEAARKNGATDRTAHVGYHLISDGRSALEKAVNVRQPWKTAPERGIRSFPLTFYVGGISLLTALGAFWLTRQAAHQGLHDGMLVLAGFIFLLCISQIAVALMNWLAMLLVKPSLLPRLDFSSGIAPGCRTMVVVPTLLTSPADIEHLIETLEIHYLANRDPHLHFALLTDFGDAPTEKLPTDAALLQQVKAGVEGLNQKYHDERADIFFLFHRPRRWNKMEKIWLGHERKRGKLAEFNRLLRGGAQECFSEITGETTVLSDVKFVITLDTDTQLPREAARKLAGTLAHPLNRPEFHPTRGVCTAGYSILQPRVGVSLPSAGRSWFVQLFAGDVGIDPYTRAVSDVYQDVFKEGSYIGKGIYDVDAFERAVASRFPENTVLSHDLLEACHARSALVSDVELYEEYPARYNTDVNRRHRWIRGDWQIIGWLRSRVPGPNGKRIANPLSYLSQWKILDNLRRSLVPTALLLVVLGGWRFPQFGFRGIFLAVLVVVLPGALSVLTDFFRKPEELPWSLHWRGLAGTAGRQLGQAALTLVFLPYDVFITLDAITRTWWRMLVSRRRLLEWQTARDVERTARTNSEGFYRTMWSAPVLAAAAGIFLVLRQPGMLPLAAPVLCLWFLAPRIAWRISQPLVAARPEIRERQRLFLHKTARMTWRFFDTFVTAEENWLPPDNFQEEPEPVIATRTSPTNIGLALLANLTAYDFGYLPVNRLIERTQNTLATMARLERHLGHFYNWYETRTLRPLLPVYVSSVDSGNLAGHLLTLAPGLTELADQRILPPRVFSGLHDTAEILAGLMTGRSRELSDLRAELAAAPVNLRTGFVLLQKVTERAARLAAALNTDPSAELKYWSRTLEQNCRDHLADVLWLAPWLARPPAIAMTNGVMDFTQLTDKVARLELTPTLRDVAQLEQSLCPLVDKALADCLAKSAAAAHSPEAARLSELLRSLHEASDRAAERIRNLENLARQSNEMANMDFTFLFDPGRDLFSIGFNVTERRRDTSFYDLLASEARLCSYVAIAQGQVAQDHWFSLARLLVASHTAPVLVSWNGSLFEYLMPLLVMPNFEKTLLDQTYRGVVQQQIEYGKLRGVPWGISESGYNRTDVQMNYQYRAFGVPGLGLKRGLAEDLVIAPYATMMALMVAPRQACENLERMAADGRCGIHGFYEAIDYTPSRLPPGQSSVTIRSYMAHHQGMGFLSMAYLLLDRPMQRRFLACPSFRAAELLLQERVPKTAIKVLSQDLALGESRGLAGEHQDTMRVLTDPSPPAPEVHLLSNGRYHVVINSAGGGYSRWRDLALTRWREDAMRDNWGMFFYLRDLETGEFWSTTFQPTLRTTKNYEAIFTQARAEFRERHGGLQIHTEISVSPEDDVEVRRIRLTNRSPEPRVIELTSYAEVVLAPAAADAAHPAFSNLFVQTEFLGPRPAILCTRRRRSEGEQPPWLLHLLVGQGGEQGEVSCETDRARFVGRGRTPANPAVMEHAAPLSNTDGSVLDPIIALRRTVTLQPGETVHLDFVMGVAETRDGALALIEKYYNPRMADRALELAWTHSQVTLRQLNASEAEAQLYARLASALVYANPARRAAPGMLANNRRGQSGLWSYGISGDVPIVLLRISDANKIEIVQQLLQAHSYWRMKGLAVELVILNEDNSVYRQPLHDQIISLIASGIEAHLLDRPGGIFVRRLDQVSTEDRVLLQSVARIVLVDENGTLNEQVGRPAAPDPVVQPLVPRRASDHPAPPLPLRKLLFENGCGGFTPDGREYVITLQPGQMTPAPWVNVLANPYFGTVVSESGSAYTWVENAHEFRLTPWNNDPVSDTTGEAFYIRDEQTGQFWSPTPLPARGRTPYVIRHGFGYTVFEHTENGIVSELTLYVAMDAPVKFATFKLRNLSGEARRLSVTGYWEWVLGDLRSKNLMHVQTELDPKSGALLARNAYNSEFAERIAFIDVADWSRTFTGDRREFLGRNGSPARPAALKRVRLSGKVGAGLDPCGAAQVMFDLAEGQEREVTFRLGVGRSPAEVQTLIHRYRRTEASRNALEEVWKHWKRTLGAVQVETPDASVNLMANGWLVYQTLSCRLWGRTGFYQSGGAYGFRDQLQDAMALVHAEPQLIREHLLRAAMHQFREGDVQHWWHPPSGRGVRTHFSDDYLWLPYVTCRYVSSVADTGVLDEKIPFLEGRPVKPEEEAYYDQPGRSAETATLYEHCVLAIENGLKFGRHGLPLMGCGDWNDGMNMVGHAGQGESVWLGFFLYDVLTQFAQLARMRNDTAFAERCLAQAAMLQKNLEENAWDGQWYRRAYFDNGDPLGSQTNSECQIDSLPQSWAVISGAGDVKRARQAMQAVDERLVRREDGLIQLFDPPFDKSSLNPGYIKGYIPGVRENGGQYTHGAIWTTMAFAMMGETERAWELFALLNPVHHGGTADQIATYKVEPYVVAADIYAVAPHVGRGGWTWYTGSAGWMYRLLIETLLGVKREGNHLRLTPRLPKNWTTYKITYCHQQTPHQITITRLAGNSPEPAQLVMDGKVLPGTLIPLRDDGRDHVVELKVR